MIALRRLSAAAVIAAALAALGVTHTAAQQQPMGAISGSVRNGTAGASASDVRVQLIAVARDGSIDSQESAAVDGRFRFSARADASITYLLRVVYRDVPYLVSPPVLISPELPTAERAITVYEPTREPPALRIASTVLSLRSLDRARGQLVLQREDQVVNPTDRVYVGAAEGNVSLRLPAPDAARAAEDGSGEAQVRLDGGVVTTTQPLRPGSTLVVTRVSVGYDQAGEDYRLRASAPLPTERMELWVPERFVDAVRAGPDGLRGETRVREGERWVVIARRGPAAGGEGVTAVLEGLSGANTPNRLTERPSALAAAALALVALIGAVAAFGRLRPRRPAVAAADE